MARRMRWMLVFAAVAVLAACSGSEESPPAGALDLTAADFAFDPTSLEAPAGETVRLEVTNDDEAEHNVTIEELDVDSDLDPGSNTSIAITGAEPGEYEFFCKFHPDQMTGALTVP